MGAFDYYFGYFGNYYRGLEPPLYKTKPCYYLTFLAEGASYYGWQNTVMFSTKKEAMSLYRKMKAAIRRPELIHANKYRMRTVIASYVADEAYHKTFHEMYPTGKVTSGSKGE